MVIVFGLCVVGAKYQAGILNASYAQPLWLWFILLSAIYYVGFFFLLGIIYFRMNSFVALVFPVLAFVLCELALYLVGRFIPRKSAIVDGTVVKVNNSPVADPSLNSCYQMLLCQQTPAYTKYTLERKRRDQCEACLVKDRCSVVVGDNVLCDDDQHYRNTSTCTAVCSPEQLLGRKDSVTNKSVSELCADALAYASAHSLSVSEGLDICQSSPGNCWFGCSGDITKTSLSGVDETATCSAGSVWNVAGDTAKKTIGYSEMGSGYPTRALCESGTGMPCFLFGVDCKRQVTLDKNANNCYCERYIVGSSVDPCEWEESKCDPHSVEMTVAQAQLASKSAVVAQPTSGVATTAPSIDQTLRKLPV
jgi:hypothetical protein